MEVLIAIVSWTLSATCRNLATDSWIRSVVCHDTSNSLAARLSEGAKIHYPGTEDFDRATNRWSVLDAPDINIVVVPATESDVAETVKYANEKAVPYLAVNGGHGAITTVGRMKDGIQIWMDQLGTVEIAQDGKTAKIGGGTLSKTVTDTLWAANKQTVTGGCECTSILGPGLGGGHGFLQGRHGLVADQFVSLNLVQADGSLQTIDQESELWWAMRGAGHNFGIVTSITSKIYDVEYPDWAYASFVFSGNQVEALFTAINQHFTDPPVHVINYGFFANVPDIDPEKAVIFFFILEEGSTKVNNKWTQPFNDIGPLSTDGAGGTYADLPTWTGNSNDAPPCQKVGLVNTRFPIDHVTYNPEAQRKAYDLFASATKAIPALNGSLYLFEGYSLQGVQAVPTESSAYPFREDKLLQAPLIIYKQDGPALQKKAEKLGEDLRQIVYRGTGRNELHAYVNYAFGNEEKKQMYGYEQWRQDKLKALKNKYDPDRKFSFYAPIA